MSAVRLTSVQWSGTSSDIVYAAPRADVAHRCAPSAFVLFKAAIVGPDPHRASMTRSLLALGLVLFAGACARQSAGWRPLFDGQSTTGWRGYRTTQVPAGWHVQD